MFGVSPLPKAVCALTPHPPHSKTLARCRIVAGERELRGEGLAGRCGRAALLFGLRSNAALPFLESVPELLAEGHQAKLKEPETKERKFEDVVKAAEKAQSRMPGEH